mgnify:CR=1 FL=1
MQQYYQKFKEKYEQVSEWHKQLEKEAVTTKLVKLPSGREYSFPDARWTEWGSATNRTAICNYPVQGFATADLLPIALVRLDAQIRNNRMKSVICNTVHDSIVVDVHPDEKIDIIFKKPSFWEKTADKTSKIAGSKIMSGMMRKVENVNRKSAFKVAFYQTYSMLKNSTEFNNQMTAKGKSAAQIEQIIIAKARRAAITTTTALHYDYSHVSKSEMMKHPVGSIVFQFQHFFNEFTNFNLKKIRGLKNDYMTQEYTGPQAMQAYRLGFAYAMLPGLLSLLFKTFSKYQNRFVLGFLNT